MSVRRVVIHAGLPKTGTSAVQATLAANRSKLRAAGVEYWDLADDHNVALAGLLRPNGPRQEKLARRAARQIGSPAEILRHLDEAIGGDGETLIISAEAVSAYTRRTLRDLVSIFEAREVKCTAVAYVREPRAALTSGVQQMLKGGHTIAEQLRERAIYDPRRRLGALVEVFGSDGRLDVRPYPGRTLLPDFLGAVGLPQHVVGSVEVASVNESFSHQAAVYLDAVNVMSAQEQIPIAASPLGRELAATYPGPRFQLPPQVHDAYLCSNPAGLRWISGMLGCDVTTLPTTVGPPPDVEVPGYPFVRRMLERGRELRAARRAVG
jgi:hypothetical protein